MFRCNSLGYAVKVGVAVARITTTTTQSKLGDLSYLIYQEYSVVRNKKLVFFASYSRGMAIAVH